MENMVLNHPPEAGTYRIIPSFIQHTWALTCVCHPGDTAVNKMDKNHCLVEPTTQYRKQTINTQKRKKMHPMLEDEKD